MNKRKGRCPSFISATIGSPQIEVAKGKRTCKRTGLAILKNEGCVTVRVAGSQGRRPYSFEAMKEIILQTRKDLDKLESAIMPSGSKLL